MAVVKQAQHAATLSAPMSATEAQLHASGKTGASKPVRSGRPELAGWEPVAQACAHAIPSLEEAFSRFWNVPVRLKFFCAAPRPLYFWQGDEFYVSQLMLNAPDVPEALKNQYIAQLRLSDQSCGTLLNEALGPASTGQKVREFNFNRMTRLEAMLMQEFSRELFLSLTRELIHKKVKTAQEADLVHLVWLIQLDLPTAKAGQSEKPLFFKDAPGIGKLVLTVPRQALKLSPIEAAPALPDESFLHALSPAILRLGKTRVPLADLQQLEPGDLVVLEQSDSHQMYLLEPESGDAFPFDVELKNRSRLEVPHDTQVLVEEQETHAMSAKQTLWDNLLIEVNAEFEPIKLPLHQLKQMSEGLVVELGDLTRNAIALQVEGKTLAHGELVVVGDRFGVRIVGVSDREDGGSPLLEGDHGAHAALTGGLDEGEHAEAPETSHGNAEEGGDDFLDEFSDDFEEDEW